MPDDLIRYEEGQQFVPAANAWVCRSVHRKLDGDYAQFKVLHARPTGTDGNFTLLNRDQIGDQVPTRGRVIFFPADTRLGEETLVIRKTHRVGMRGWCAIATRPGDKLPAMWQEPTQG